MSQSDPIIHDDHESPLGDGAVVVCMAGPFSRCPLPEYSSSGKCTDCGLPIFYAVTVPTKVKKICCSCALKSQEDFEGYGVTETTVTEVLPELGLPDTPEIRETIMKHMKTNFQKWMEQEAEECERLRKELEG